MGTRDMARSILRSTTQILCNNSVPQMAEKSHHHCLIAKDGLAFTVILLSQPKFMQLKKVAKFNQAVVAYALIPVSGPKK